MVDQVVDHQRAVMVLLLEVLEIHLLLLLHKVILEVMELQTHQDFRQLDQAVVVKTQL
jgi:hypothetical protein